MQHTVTVTVDFEHAGDPSSYSGRFDQSASVRTVIETAAQHLAITLFDFEVIYNGSVLALDNSLADACRLFEGSTILLSVRLKEDLPASSTTKESFGGIAGRGAVAQPGSPSVDDDLLEDAEIGEEEFDDALGATTSLEVAPAASAPLPSAAMVGESRSLSATATPSFRRSSPAPAEAESPREVQRKATVRYYEQMNPGKMFPLLVVLSPETIQKVAKKGVAQTTSAAFTVDRTEVVEVEPLIPGCDCYPQRASVELNATESQAKFWIVPRVIGKIFDPKVMIRQKGRVIADIAMTMKVRRQTAAIAIGIASFFAPVASALIQDYEATALGGQSLVVTLIYSLLHNISPDLLFGVLLAAAFAFYLWARPRKRDVFWDVTPLDADTELEKVKTALASGNPHRAVESINSLLETNPEHQPSWIFCGDWHFERENYDQAWRHYEKALDLGPLPKDVRMRTSIAARKTGNVAELQAKT